SGIYDLEPIRHSYLNVKLGLDEAASHRNSPMAQAGGVLKPLSLVAGDAELPLLRRQTADFAGHREFESARAPGLEPGDGHLVRRHRQDPGARGTRDLHGRGS
ncbi:MAG: hypothetical protein ACMG6S_15865, partial [Byssovorax sp.]